MMPKYIKARLQNAEYVESVKDLVLAEYSLGNHIVENIRKKTKLDSYTIQHVLKSCGLMSEGGKRAQGMKDRAERIVEIANSEPYQYSFYEICQHLGVDSASTQRYFKNNCITAKFRTEPAPPKLPKAPRTLKVQSKEKTKRPIYELDGYNELMALAAKMPPPNFIGMSDTKIRLNG